MATVRSSIRSAAGGRRMQPTLSLDGLPAAGRSVIVRAMARTIELEVALLTAEAFAPFGAVLGVEDRPLDFQGSGIHGWATGFESDAGALLMVLESPYQGLRITMLERHLNVTQAAIPLGGPPSVIAAAAPTDPDDPEAIPDPAEVRAFLVDGSKGYVFAKGTWHTNRYPLHPPAAVFFLVTDPATQDELVRLPEQEWKRTQQVDYETRFGVVFEAVLARYGSDTP